MAQKKKRGRPRKITAKQPRKPGAENPVQAVPAAPAPAPATQQKTTLEDRVGNLFKKIVGAESSPASTPTTGNFQQTAEKLKADFPPAPDGASADSGPVPAEVLPPEAGPQFVSRVTVEKYYRIFFDGMRAHFGERWELDEMEFTFHAQLATDAANEQLPRLFADSQNKCLYAWLLGTGLMVFARSEAGVKLIERLSTLLQGISFGTQPPTEQPRE